MSNLQSPNSWLDRYLTYPGNHKSLHNSKKLIWSWAIMAGFALTGITLIAMFLKVWILFWFGITLMAGYSIAISMFLRYRNFELILFVFLLSIICITFLFILKLGGITHSMGLEFVGLICVMSSVLLRSGKWSIIVFCVYALTILSAWFLQPYVEASGQYPPIANPLLHVLNILWITASALIFISYYLKHRINIEKTKLNLGAPVRKAKSKSVANSKQDEEFIAKVRQIVAANLGEETFGVAELCQKLNMSRAQFYRKFKKVTNIPIGKFIRLLRLQKAKKMLLESDRNVTEVAIETGFKNLSHFSTAFKEEFGVSPSRLEHI